MGWHKDWAQNINARWLLMLRRHKRWPDPKRDAVKTSLFVHISRELPLFNLLVIRTNYSINSPSSNCFFLKFIVQMGNPNFNLFMQIVPLERVCSVCIPSIRKVVPWQKRFSFFFTSEFQKVKYRPISCLTVLSVFLANSTICPTFPDHGNHIVVRSTISMRGQMNKCALSAQYTDSDKVYLLYWRISCCRLHLFPTSPLFIFPSMDHILFAAKRLPGSSHGLYFFPPFFP